jgi:hypothetical protein
MSKAITITKEDMALLKEASEMFNETGCVPGLDGEQVPAEKILPDVKERSSPSAVLPSSAQARLSILSVSLETPSA